MSVATRLLTIWIVSASVSAAKSTQTHQFLRQPYNLTVRLGMPAFLRCAITNMQTGVQWSIDGFALGKTFADPRLSLQGNEAIGEYNLGISDAQLKDDGEYRCLVYPDADKGLQPLKSRPAYLNVIVPPAEVALEPTASGTIDVELSGSVTITCTVPDTKPSSQIRWEVGGRDYDGAVSKKLTSGSRNKLTNTSSSITLRPTELESGSVVECIVTHLGLDAAVSRTATLNILYPPNPPKISGFQKKPMQSGQLLRLSCDAAGGNPKAKITWLIGDEIIQRDYEHTTTGSRSLLSHQLRPQDNGKVLACRAETRPLAAPLDDEVRLEVYYPPESIIIEREPEEGTQENGVMIFTCRCAPSNPKSTLTWHINNAKLPPQWDTNVGTVPYIIDNSGFRMSHDRTSLTLTNVQRQDADLTITCRASIPEIDYNGDAQTQPKVNYPPRKVDVSIFSLSSPIAIPINEKEQFTASLSDENSNSVYKAGDVIMLKCQAKGGNPPPNLTWFQNGVPFANDGSVKVSALPEVKVQTSRSAPDSVYGEFVTVTTLELTLKPSQNGAFISCIARHPGYKAAVSDKKRLKVAFPPAGLTVEQFPSSLVIGKPMSLTCKTAPSNPVAKVSWYQHGVKLSSHLSMNLPNVKGTMGGFVARSRLQVTPSQEDDGASYTCKAEVETLLETVTQQYKLHIEYPPIFYPVNDNKTSYNATEGDSFIDIVVVTRANPRQTTFSWFRIIPFKTEDGSEILTKIALTKDRRLVWAEDKGALKINNPRKDDGGLYTVCASNSRGSTELTITLNVFYPPNIVRVSIPAKTLTEGDSAILRCDFNSHLLTPTHVTWVKEVPGNGRSKYDVETCAEYSTLTLEHLTSADRGGYKCIVDNGIGGGDTRDVTLSLLHAPVFDDLTPSKVAISSIEGGGPITSTAILTCMVYSSPAATITWAVGNLTIDAINDDRYSVQEVVSIDATRSTLQIHAFGRAGQDKSAAFPVFSCVASNSLGKRTKEIHLVAEGPPDAPSELNAYNVSDSSVCLAWKRGFDNGVRQQFIIQYKKSAEDNAKGGFSEVTAKSNVGLIGNLDQNQEYLIRIAAVNDNGRSVPSETIRVRTSRLMREVSSVLGARQTYVVVLAVVGVVIIALVTGVAVMSFRRCKISKQSYRPKLAETDCESLTHPGSSVCSRRSSIKRSECERLEAEKRGECKLSKAQIESTNNRQMSREDVDEVSIPLQTFEIGQSCYFDRSASTCSSHQSAERPSDAGCGPNTSCTFTSLKSDAPRAEPPHFSRFGSRSVRIQRPVTEERNLRKFSEPRFRYDVVPTDDCLEGLNGKLYDRPLDLPLPPSLAPRENHNYVKRPSSSLDVRGGCSYSGNANDCIGNTRHGSFRQYRTLGPTKYNFDTGYDGHISQMLESRTSFVNQAAPSRKYHPTSSVNSTETCLYNVVSRPADAYATSLLTMPRLDSEEYRPPEASRGRIRESQSSSTSNNSGCLYVRSLDNMTDGAPEERQGIVNDDGSINTFGLDLPPPPLDVIREFHSQDPLPRSQDCQAERRNMLPFPSGADEMFVDGKSYSKVAISAKTPVPTSSVRFRDELSKALSSQRSREMPNTTYRGSDDHFDGDSDSGCGGSADVQVHSDPSPVSENSAYSPVSSICQEGMVLRV